MRLGRQYSRHVLKVSRMHKVRQALVAIGGHAERLGDAAGTTGPKSFIHFGGRTALYWTLRNMRTAGISRVVLAGDTRELLHAGRVEALRAGFRAGQITVFSDEGLGVHGIPYQARSLLDPRFIFDAGHSMCPAGHYFSLRLARDGFSTYSTFEERHGNASRLHISADGPRHVRVQHGVSSRVLALPYALDTDWASRIAAFDFQLRQVVAADILAGRARFQAGEFEPEFDVPSEWRAVRQQFVRNRLGTIAFQSGWLLENVSTRLDAAWGA